MGMPSIKSKGEVVQDVVALEELIALLNGDELSTGYVSGHLILEICQRTKPVDLKTLVYRCYKHWSPEKLEPEILEIFQNTFNLWNRIKNK